MAMKFERLSIPEVILIRLDRFGDDRGFFRETYKMSEFCVNGIPGPFVQDNHSHSARGVLRGLHYQKHPHAQGKLLLVTAGEIFDVAVDIRRGSPTYGQWVGQTLSVHNGSMLYVPPGFAHGFCVVSETADLVYKTTDEYTPELERGIMWNDPDIQIQWPMPEPVLSPRDARLPKLQDADNNFTYTAI